LGNGAYRPQQSVKLRKNKSLTTQPASGSTLVPLADFFSALSCTYV
jgi:hypothetical protein